MKKVLFLMVMLAALCWPAANAQYTATFGTGTYATSTGGSAGAPMSYGAVYSWVQQIYRAEELTAANVPAGAVIHSISFFNATGATTMSDIRTYMGHCANEYFSSLTDWVPYNTLSLVDSGDWVTTDTGWFEINFDAPFVWDGTSNIVIGVSFRGVHSDYLTNNPNCGYRYTDQVDNAQIRRYTNSVESCDPTDTTAASFLSVKRPNLRITYTFNCENAITAVTDIAPFTDDFETDPCWQLINGDMTNAWTHGSAVNNGGNKALYISNNGGASNAYTNSSSSVVYATKRFNLTAGQHDFSFDWKCTGEVGWDFLRVALVPGSPELTASTYLPNGLSKSTLPEGWIALDGGKQLNGSNTWTAQQNSNVNITEAGIYTVVLVWRNDGSSGTNPPAAIDNFNVTKAACPSPYNLAVSDITSTTAALQFSTYGQSSFTYALAKANEFDVTNSNQWHTMTGTSTTLAGLEPFTKYTVAVKSSCPDNGTTSQWSKPVSFTTTLDCGSQASRQFVIGTHTTTSSAYPFYSLASSSGNYGASWQIFTAEEILNGSEFPGTIKGIAWKSTQNASIPFQIYMANTSKEAFVNATDTVSRATMTKVYDGTTDFVAGEWTDIAFTTPFEYDATGNLLIMVYRSAPALSQSVSFELSACDGNKTIYYSGAEGLETGYDMSNRNNTRFTMCVTEDECMPVQNLRITKLNTEVALFSWTDDRNADASYYVACAREGAFHNGYLIPFTPNSNNTNNGVYSYGYAGFEPNTSYEIYAQANCGTSRSVLKKVTFTTPCDFVTLPYTCGFEEEEGLGTESRPMPTCWIRYNDANSTYNYFPYVQNSSEYYPAHTGSKSLYFSGYATSAYADNQIAVLPPVNIIGQPAPAQMLLWARSKGSSSGGPATIQVGTMTNPYDGTTFVADATIVLTDEYREYVVRLNNDIDFYPAIRMQKPATSTPDVFVDDVTVEHVPTCPKPLYVEVDTVTATTATISWTPGGSETKWNVEYSFEGSAVTITKVVQGTSHYVLTDLVPNSSYTVRVQADCQNTYYSVFSSPATFRTLCGETNPLPYTENFDDFSNVVTNYFLLDDAGYPNVDLPYCWMFPNRSASANSSSGFPKTYIYDDDNGNVLAGSVKRGDGAWFGILPRFEQSIHHLMLTFSYNRIGDSLSGGSISSFPRLKVGYMTDPADTSSFHELYTCSESVDEYVTQELLFNTVSADYDDAWIAFKAIPRDSYHEEFFIDNVTVEPIPTCFKPDSLAVTGLSHNSVTVAWKRSHFSEAFQIFDNAYQVAFGPSATFDLTDPSTYTVISNDTFSYWMSCYVSGLASETEYTFVVRAMCGNDDWSDWSLPVSVQTMCVVNSLPYSENFDTYTGYSTSSSGTINVPYNYPTGRVLPDCWHFPYISDYRYIEPNTYLLSDTNFAVSGNALMMHSGDEHPSAYAVLPMFSTSLSQLQVSFTYSYYRERNNDDTLVLGYMTNPADTNTFVPVYTCMPNTDKIPVEFAFDNAAAQISNAHIAFRYKVNAYGIDEYVGIDNVVVEPIPACRRPVIWFDNNLTGIRIPSSQNYYNLSVFYSIPNEISGHNYFCTIAVGDKEIFDLEDPSTYNEYWVNTIGEESGTSHGVVVYAIPGVDNSIAMRIRCSDNPDTVWSDWSNFLTARAECETMDVPYLEYFDDYTKGISEYSSCPHEYPNVDLPECWNFFYPSESRIEYPQVYLSSSSYCTKSGNALVMHASETEPIYAMLPPFSNTEPLELSYYYSYGHPGTRAGTLAVGYIPQIPYVYEGETYYDESYSFSGFVLLDTCPVTTDMTFRKLRISNLPEGARIAFKFICGTGYNGSPYDDSYVSIDELEVVPASSCTESVEILEIAEITDRSAKVIWGDELESIGSYLVCGPAATFDRFDASTYEQVMSTESAYMGALVNRQWYTFDNLQPNTEYAFAIARNCSNGIRGEWSRVMTAKTLCTPTSFLPYTENFDSYTHGISSSSSKPDGYPDVDQPECWSFFNNNKFSSAFLTNSWIYALSGNSLELYPESHDTIIAMLPTFDENIRNLKLSFSYKNSSTSDNEPQLSVGYMTTTYDYHAPYEYVEIAKLDRRTSATTVEIRFDTVPFIDNNEPTYIAFRCEAPNWSGEVFIDNVTVVSTDPCYAYVDVDHPFTDDFESDNCWQLINDTLTNAWTIGSAVNNGGNKALYISNDGGTSNAYTISGKLATVYATKTISLSAGMYNVSFDWKAYGEGSYDFLRAALVPDSVVLTASLTRPSNINYNVLPPDWIALDGGTKLNLSSSWKTFANDEIIVPEDGLYKVVFVWRNDGNGGSNPPIAIDNLSISKQSCPKPYNLTINNVTETSATLQFDLEDEADDFTYILDTEANFDTANTANYVNTSDISNLITGLALGTTYTVAVRTNCGDNEHSVWSKPITFSPRCNTAASLPYTENFDSYTQGISSNQIAPTDYPQGDLPACWTFVNRSLSTSTTPRVFLSSMSGYRVSGNALFFNTNSTTPLYAVLPAFEDDIHNLQLSFKYRLGEYSSLYVGYMTDPFDEQTFVSLDYRTSSYTVYDTVSPMVVTFDNVPAGVSAFIVFKILGTSGVSNLPLSIDDVVVEVAPSCMKAFDLEVTGVTDEAVSIRWTEKSNITTDYEVAYGPSSTFNLDAGMYESFTLPRTTAYAQATTITDLTASTPYTFAVRRNCKNGSWSEWTLVSATTQSACGEYATLPYTENFDSYTHHISRSTYPADGYPNEDKPNCWTYLNRYPSRDHNPWIFLTNVSTYAASGNALYFNAPTNTPVYAVMPAFNEELGQLKLNFTYRTSGTSAATGTLSVGYMTDPTDTATFVELQPLAKVGTKTTAEVLFSEYDLPAALVSPHIAFRFLGGNGSSSLGIDNVTVELVAANPCDPVVVDLTHPYTDNFETDQCWQLINDTCTNAWVWGSATNYGGEKALYISNDGGVSNAYNNKPTATVYAAKRFSLPAGEYTASYDWRALGESSFDYLRVALVPDSVVLTAGTTKPSSLSSNTLPAGWIALDNGSKLNLSTTWNNMEAGNFFITEPGNYKVVFVWHNDNSDCNNPPAAIDNFSISKLPCPKPFDLSVQNITTNSATLQFSTFQEALDYTYIVDKTADFDLTNSSKYVYTSNLSNTISNLEPYTYYTVAVRTNCGDVISSQWTDPVQFYTMPDCDEQSLHRFAIGAQTFTTPYVPMYSYAGSSYKIGASWQIFTAEEILENTDFPGTIKGIAWKANKDVSIPFQIYMANTDKDTFAVKTDTVSRATMTKVYDGTTQFAANEWTEIVFDTPFEYDATGNLLIMVYRPAPALSSSVSFQYTSGDDYRTLYLYGASSLIVGNKSLYRTNTRFTMCVTEDECMPVQDLRISSIGDTYFGISWTDTRNAGAPDYRLEIGPAGFTPGTGSVITVEHLNSNDGYQGTEIGPFTPSTSYDVYVSAICGEGDTSIAKKLTVTTTCAFLTELPYTCGFEPEDGIGAGSNPMPNCWHRYNDAYNPTGYTYPNYPYVGSVTPESNSANVHQGNGYLYFYTNTASSYAENQIAVLPPISSSAYPMGQNQMVFWAKTTNSYGASIQVGTMTNPYDINTFELAETVELTLDYREYVVRFPSYTYSVFCYPAIRMVRDTLNHTAYLDDLTVEVKPACAKPLDVTVDNVTRTSARFSWTPGADENGWEVKAVSEDGSDSITVQTSANPFVVTGLQPGTKYFGYVKAICSNAESSVWSAPDWFNTLCDPLATLPYEENFNSYTTGVSSNVSYPRHYPKVTMPDCWKFVNRSENAATTPLAFLTSNSDYVTSGNALCIKSNPSTPLYALLPEFEENISNLSLTFTYRNGGTTQNDGILSVGYMTDPTADSSFVELVSLEKVSVMTPVEVLFDNVPANATNIAFKYAGSSNNYNMIIEDVVVTEALSCSRVTNLAVTGVTTNSVSLTWTNPNVTTAGFDVAYGLASSFNLSNTSTYQTLSCSSTTATITGLTENTSYTFAVRTRCSSNEWSYWSLAPVTARTKCSSISVPYTEDFNSYTEGVATSSSAPSNYPNVDLPDCWTFVNRSMGSSAYPQAFLTKYSSFAVSGNCLFFKSSSTTPLYAVLPHFAEDIHHLKLSFTYRNEGTSEADGTLSVGYVTNLADANSFVELRSFEKTTTKTSVEVSFDSLPASITAANIAFKYIGGTSNGYYLGIDEVSVVSTAPACPPITVLPYTENFDGYTTSTTAATGVEPDCWEVVQEDMAMSDATRPQVFYNNTYAHSGSYSLRMHYRGIYAMPALSDTIALNTLKMDMYVRQANSSYQLQVGVWEDGGTFVPVATVSNSTTGVEHVVIDFTGYTGTGHRIAFRNINTSNSSSYSLNYIDNITLSKISDTPTPPCATITLPYSEDFDSYTESTTAATGVEPTCWELVQEDMAMSDATRPQVFYNNTYAHSGSYSLRMHYRGIYAMPALSDTIALNTLTMDMYVRQANSNYRLQVGVWEDGGTFVPVATVNNTTTGVEHVEIDFSDYTGTGHRIAFRNINTSNSSSYSLNYIDDITLSKTTDTPTPPCATITLPYSENFDSYTESTSTATGVEPDCWELLYADMTITNATKPQLYYNSAYAHSGSYSLRMHYRGIYAMPAFSDTIALNTLRLEMYLRQAKAYNALQVGVWEDDGSFVPVATLNNSTTGVEHVEVDFTSYTGTGHRIAFRNINANGDASYSLNYLDDITLSEVHETPVSPCAIISLPYSENFDSYTESTSTATGVEPDCWDLLFADMTITDATKPQLYYNSAYAHSGSYSLRMHYRGIYAMPAFSDNIELSSLKLEMYLRQPKAYNALQVGVWEDDGSFVPVATLNNSTTGVEFVEVDFTDYTGNGHRIAFRNINTNGDASYSLNYLDDITVKRACEIETLPYFENFDDYTESTTAATGVEPKCWMLVQEDMTITDATKPQVFYNNTYAHSGSYSLRMHYRGIYALPAFSESIALNSLILEMYLRQPQSYYALQVGVWEDDGSFVPVATLNNSSTGLEHVIVDLTDYTGNGHRIAFRNINTNNASGYSLNYIDDITVKRACEIETIPYLENFDDYTESTTAATGVEPKCWKLVQADMSMTDATKPQLYYNSSYAHSSSYSLRLHYRGIYAMSPLSDGIALNTLKLEMYLRQPQSPYALQVGVWEDGGTFVPVATVNNSTTGVEHVEIDFSGYTGTGHRIAFRNINTSNSSSYSLNYLDDITLSRIPDKLAEVETGNGSAATGDGNVEDDMEIGTPMGVDGFVEDLGNITVYPNPTTGQLHIDAIDVTRVECYSQMGQLVAVFEHERDIDISHLSSGVYMLRVTLPQGVAVRKVVKK